MPEPEITRAGSHWRVLVHQMLPKGRCGPSHEVSSESLPGTEFDELVIGQFLHLEQMDTGRWWMNVAGVTVWIEADPGGRPTSVNVYGPGDYAGPVEGVVYGGPALADEWPPTDATERDESHSDTNRDGLSAGPGLRDVPAGNLGEVGSGE